MTPSLLNFCISLVLAAAASHLTPTSEHSVATNGDTGQEKAAPVMANHWQAVTVGPDALFQQVGKWSAAGRPHGRKRPLSQTEVNTQAQIYLIVSDVRHR